MLDTEDYWNCCWYNTAFTSKIIPKVQMLSPGKVRVPMAAVKEAWSSGRDANAPEGKLQGYKGRLDHGMKPSIAHSEEANEPLYSM